MYLGPHLKKIEMGIKRFYLQFRNECYKVLYQPTDKKEFTLGKKNRVLASMIRVFTTYDHVKPSAGITRRLLKLHKNKQAASTKFKDNNINKGLFYTFIGCDYRTQSSALSYCHWKWLKMTSV